MVFTQQEMCMQPSLQAPAVFTGVPSAFTGRQREMLRAMKNSEVDADPQVQKLLADLRRAEDGYAAARATTAVGEMIARLEGPAAAGAEENEDRFVSRAQ